MVWILLLLVAWFHVLVNYIYKVCLVRLDLHINLTKYLELVVGGKGKEQRGKR